MKTAYLLFGLLINLLPLAHLTAYDDDSSLLQIATEEPAAKSSSAALSAALTDKEKNELARSAKEASKKAYAPYSKCLEGAALLTQSGEVYSGANVENASYGLTICAERSAIFQAVNDGNREFKAIAISLKNGEFPCGACRQVLNEFNSDLIVLMVDEEGMKIKETTLKELLPNAFGPKNL